MPHALFQVRNTNPPSSTLLTFLGLGNFVAFFSLSVLFCLKILKNDLSKMITVSAACKFSPTPLKPRGRSEEQTFKASQCAMLGVIHRPLAQSRCFFIRIKKQSKLHKVNCVAEEANASGTPCARAEQEDKNGLLRIVKATEQSGAVLPFHPA